MAGLFQYITGPAVNAMLILSALTVGIKGAAQMLQLPQLLSLESLEVR